MKLEWRLSPILAAYCQGRALWQLTAKVVSSLRTTYCYHRINLVIRQGGPDVKVTYGDPRYLLGRQKSPKSKRQDDL